MMKLLVRFLAILIDPFAEWARIEKEPGDPIYLMTSYVALLALIPAVFGFIGACVIGVIVRGTAPVRAPILNGLFGAVFGYLAGFVLVVLLGLTVKLAAPLFGARRNFASALNLAVYSYTPVWLAGVFLLLPGLRFLTLSGFYGVYLLIAGLSVMMKVPPSKLPGFAALVVAVACALTFIVAGAQHTLFGVPPV